MSLGRRWAGPQQKHLFFPTGAAHLGTTRPPVGLARSYPNCLEDPLMRGTPVLVAALTLVAAHGLGAQEYMWTADRPDAVAPAGITNDRTLGAGNLELAYRFNRTELTGLKFGNQIFDPNEALDLFTFVPVEGVAEAHIVHVGLGLNDDLTVTATGG